MEYRKTPGRLSIASVTTPASGSTNSGRIKSCGVRVVSLARLRLQLVLLSLLNRVAGYLPMVGLFMVFKSFVFERKTGKLYLLVVTKTSSIIHEGYLRMTKEFAVLAPLIDPLTKSKTVAVVDEITSEILKTVLLPLKEHLSPIVQRYNATEFLNNNVAPKLEAVPAKNRVEPSVKIFKRVLEGALEVPDEPLLKEMFANLLVSDMNTEMKSKVHPKFASVLADMSVAEAKLLQAFKETTSLPMLKLHAESQVIVGGITSVDDKYQYHQSFYDTGLSCDEIQDTILQYRLSGIIHSMPIGRSLYPPSSEDPWFEWYEAYKNQSAWYGYQFELIKLTSFGINFRDVVLP